MSHVILPVKTFLLSLGFCAAIVFTPFSLGAQETMVSEDSTMAGESSAAPSVPAKPVSRAAEILRRFDKNGDGRLDEDEKAEAHETMLEEQMGKGTRSVARDLGAVQALALDLFDRNRDRHLDEDERYDALVFVQQSGDRAVRDTLLKRFDRNHDNKLDEEERREVQAYAEEHRGELMHELLLKRFDANANGQFEPEEKMAVREAFLNMPPTGAERAAAQKFVEEQGGGLVRAFWRKRFDANGNGRLDPDEERAAREYSHDHRGEIIREVMLKRFDKNGDGLLDEQERATLREALKPAIAPLAPAFRGGGVADVETNSTKNIDGAKSTTLRAEIERRRFDREEKPVAPAETPPTEKK